MFTALKRCLLACYSLKFYQTAESDSFAKRFLTLLLAAYVLLALGGAWLAQTVAVQLPQLQAANQKFTKTFPALLPADLSLEIDPKAGRLSTSKPGPHKINMIEAFSFLKPNESVLVIDADADGINPAAYEATMLAGPQGLSVVSPTGKIQYWAYAELLRNTGERFVVNREWLSQIPTSITSVLKWTEQNYWPLVFALFLGILPLLALSLSSWKLVVLWLYSLPGFFLLKLFKRPQSLSALYRQGIYISIPLLLLQVLTFFALSAWLYLLAYLLLVLIFNQPTKTQNEVEVVIER